jgi:urease accessory protein
MIPTAGAALLALADQRLPGGGHVHSGGMEQAITDGLARDVETLERFLERRLATAGLVAAGLAAAATRLTGGPDAARLVTVLDAEADARTPSPAQRLASRAQGRGLLRTARAAWVAPSAYLSWSGLGARPHHPIVLGCAAHAGGLTPDAAALVAAYLAVSAPATAAQRLLALDPVAVAAVTIRLGPAIERIAAAAVTPPADTPGNRRISGPGPAYPPVTGRMSGEWAGLPSDSDPLLDLLAERHAARKERLFAS